MGSSRMARNAGMQLAASAYGGKNQCDAREGGKICGLKPRKSSPAMRCETISALAKPARSAYTAAIPSPTAQDHIEDRASLVRREAQS